MANSNYNLCFLALILFTTNIRSENDLHNHTHLEKLPLLRKCHRSDPDLNNCIKEAIEDLRPYLAKGIPELFIPSCEPLYIPEIVMNQGNINSVGVQSTYRNIRVYGPSEFVLKTLKVDLEKMRIRIKLQLPYLRMTANYSIIGNILMLPINASGISEGNYTNIEANIFVQCNTFKFHNKKHFNVREVAIDFNIGHASVYFSDLFPGDSELALEMNNFLNDNWIPVSLEFKPILEETIGNMFKKFANKLYHKYPVDDILPI
ncbi:protein takeout-like [Sipha flava]|uniref:Protein takeout-like n=1 Tax=Sipha flava TaxID=143950 RepID=A0A8B8FZD7_9HEMI|nr:protein takeout-like [Sipha flava]XP_025415712.1 protein takeout-like [Sipha flava]